MTRRPDPNSGLLTIRTMFVLLLAVLAGGCTGGLAWLAGHNPPESALAGLAALGGGIRFFDWLIA
jgi:hypothetical protein